MDLIAPQFSEFVADKLTKSMADNILTDSKHEQGNNGRDMRDIMFAGEIVAIMRPGDKGFRLDFSLGQKERKSYILYV